MAPSDVHVGEPMWRGDKDGEGKVVLTVTAAASYRQSCFHSPPIDPADGMLIGKSMPRELRICLTDFYSFEF